MRSILLIMVIASYLMFSMGSQNQYPKAEKQQKKTDDPAKNGTDRVFKLTIGEQIEDHFLILGANETDSMEEIKKKYRDLAKLHHPDMQIHRANVCSVSTSPHPFMSNKSNHAHSPSKVDKKTERESAVGQVKECVGMERINEAYEAIKAHKSRKRLSPAAHVLLAKLGEWWNNIPLKERDNWSKQLGNYFQSPAFQSDLYYSGRILSEDERAEDLREKLLPVFTLFRSLSLLLNLIITLALIGILAILYLFCKFVWYAVRYSWWTCLVLGRLVYKMCGFLNIFFRKQVKEEREKVGEDSRER